MQITSGYADAREKYARGIVMLSMLDARARGHKFGPNAFHGSGAIQVVLSHTELGSTGSIGIPNIAPHGYGDVKHAVWDKPNERAKMPGPVSVRDMVEFIQQSFALNVTQAAAVLDVERRSIYHWMKRDDVKLQERTETRVKEIYKLAQAWAGMGGVEHNGKLSHIFDGLSMIDLLSSKSLDIPTIHRIMKALVESKPNRDAGRTAAKQALKHVLQELAMPNALVKVFTPAQGQVAYGTDPEYPGMIVQLHPDGRRIPGRLKDGKFCPAEGE